MNSIMVERTPGARVGPLLKFGVEFGPSEVGSEFGPSEVGSEVGL